MKHKDLAKKLVELGWKLLRQGGSHEIWTDGEYTVAVPRHREINEITAAKIIKTAAKFGKGINNVD